MPMEPTLFRALKLFKDLAVYWRINLFCEACGYEYEICGICGGSSEPDKNNIKHCDSCTQEENLVLADNIQITEAGVIDNLQGEEYSHEWGFYLGSYYFAVYVADESGKCFQDLGKLWSWLETASRIFGALSVPLQTIISKVCK